MSPTDPTRLTLLLDEVNWVRALARRLVGDAHLADDVTQETWLIGLERARTGELPTRSWLAGVLRNRIFKARRSRARRRLREEAVAREEAVEGADRLVERASVHRDVVEAVTGLDEIYRTVVLMRYLEERTPTAIAEELGLPRSTVKTRLARGIQCLRDRLDAAYGGDGRTWVLALYPFAGLTVPPVGPVGPVGPGAPGAPMTTTMTKGTTGAVSSTAVGATAKLLILGASIASLALGVHWLRAGPIDEVDEPERVQVGVVQEHVSAGESADTDRTADGRRPAAGLALDSRVARPVPERTDAPSPTAKPSALRTLRGRVFDAAGVPLGDVRIVYQADSGSTVVDVDTPTTVSGRDGTFELTASTLPGIVVVDEPELVTAFAGKADAQLGVAELVLIAAPAGHIGGRVLDGLGRPLAGATVRVTWPLSVRNGPGRVMDYSMPMDTSMRTDEAGRFLFARTALIPGSEVVAVRRGLRSAHQPGPLTSTTDLSFVLGTPGMAGDALLGQVLDSDGWPVVDARVALGIEAVWTDVEGMFRFQITDELAREDRLIAFVPGREPARLEAQRIDGRVSWPEGLTLRLGAATRPLTGVVCDPSGAPRAGLRVWLEEMHLFSVDPDGAVLLENALAGAPGTPTYYRETDAQGRFRFDAVLDRTYTVIAVDPATLERAELGQATGDVSSAAQRFTFERPGSHGRVAGRVVDSSGNPLADVAVTASVRTYSGYHDDHDVVAHAEVSPPIVTDREGHFELGELPVTVHSILAMSPVHVPGSVDLRQVEGALEDLVIVLERRVHLLVELADPRVADRISVVDDQGRPVKLHVYSSVTRRLSADTLPLERGTCDTFTVPASAATLLLLERGQVVRRVPLIDVIPGEVHRLRL